MKFCEKNVLCEKGDEITRFDCIQLKPPTIPLILLCNGAVRQFTNTKYNISETKCA
jgi:hypothetical protein